MTHSSEPRLNDIGTRPKSLDSDVEKCSEPKLNDIGVRQSSIVASLPSSSEPS